MKIILYTPKLNKALGTYLAFANISADGPATANQKPIDYAAFFVSSNDAENAVEAYLNHPACKMSKSNKKFISIEPYEFEVDTNKRFPFTSELKMIDTSGLKDADHIKFRPMLLNYGSYTGIIFVCADAYKSL